MLGGPYIDIFLDPWDYEILLEDKTGRGQFGEVEEFLDEKPTLTKYVATDADYRVEELTGEEYIDKLSRIMGKYAVTGYRRVD
jgi:hypothetical protein